MLLLIESSNLIEWGGLFLIIAFVFAETGLLLGLIIPGGETLLFAAGLLVSTGTLEIDIIPLLIVIMLAAFTGDLCGFFIGRKFKKRLFGKEDTWYFRKKYLDIAKKYVEKHQKGALILGKFLPVIRPFSPVVSGTTSMSFSSFIPVSVAAVVLYTGVFTLMGYLLGSQFPQIKDYLAYILPLSIIVAIASVVIQVRKNS